jgi:crossover junction endodeoxyribonuclease RuvC
MRVLGIDPGSTVTGYGIIENQRGRLVHVASGCIRTRAETPMAERLTAIHAGLAAAIEAHRPDEIAIEAIFRHKSSESALRLGQARGVALLAAGQRGYHPYEYNASTVKASVGAHGKADKAGIAKMVHMLLGGAIPGPADVTDALAIAITHCAHARTAALRTLPGDAR